jgi:probable HAF family extracellular repeat protein
MRDLNTLLTDARVNMRGIALILALGVSGNGKVIAGMASFRNGPDHAYLVYYDDGPKHKGPVIAGITTPQAVQGSVNDLGRERQQAMIEQQALGDPVLDPAARQTQFTNDIALLVDGAFVQSNHQGALRGGFRDDAIRANLALRYLRAKGASVRPLAEIGGWTRPNTAFSFERKYVNGSGVSQGEGFANGTVSSLFARAGMVWQPAPADQVMVTGEIDRDWSSVGAYAERYSQANPFEAYVSSGTDKMSVTKFRLNWNHHFGNRIDTTLWAAAAQSFDDTVGLTAAVPASGDLVPIGLTSMTWAEYGGRVGLKLSPQFAADVLIGGVSGSGGMGTTAHVRVAARMAF